MTLIKSKLMGSVIQWWSSSRLLCGRSEPRTVIRWISSTLRGATRRSAKVSILTRAMTKTKSNRTSKDLIFTATPLPEPIIQ